jgi:hypothetical protein
VFEVSKNKILTIEENVPNISSNNKIQDKINDKTDNNSAQNSISLNKVSDIWSKSNNSEDNKENKSKVKIDMSNIESNDN